MAKLGEKTYSVERMAKLAGEEFHATMYTQQMPEVSASQEQPQQPSYDQMLAEAAQQGQSRMQAQERGQGMER